MATPVTGMDRNEPIHSCIGYHLPSRGIIISLVFFILAFVWGCILSFGSVSTTVNGVVKNVNEPLIGYGLFCISGFFASNLAMFITVLLAKSVSINKNGSYWFYSFTVGIVGLWSSLYFFIQKIGYNSSLEILLCSILVVVSVLLSGFVIYYTHAIASPFKGTGRDSVLKLKIVDNDPNSFSNKMARRGFEGENINIQIKLF